MNSRPPITVLFIHQAAELYGSDKVLLYLVSGLHRREGFRPIVVLPEMGPLWDALVNAGVEVHVSEIAKIRRSVFSVKGLIDLMRRSWHSVGQLDAIVGERAVSIVHSNTLAVLAGAVWAWRRKVPHLWHVHEIVLSPRLVSLAFPLMVRLAADKVMSNSTLTEQWLVKSQPALAKRSVVVFNGLPPQALAPTDAVAEFRARVRAAADEVLVVLAGRVNHWKGQGLLIEAARLLHQRGDLGTMRFAIVGDTVPGQEALLVQLKRQVAEAGLTGAFTFVPFVDDIRPAWQGADIAVVPSTEPEPFGMVAIEAMAAGVPVVAARHGGLLDIVEHEVTGLLFEPRDAHALANALRVLALDAPLRHRLGVAGALRQLERFSADSQVIKSERVYEQMLGLAGP